MEKTFTHHVVARKELTISEIAHHGAYTTVRATVPKVIRTLQEAKDSLQENLDYWKAKMDSLEDVSRLSSDGRHDYKQAKNNYQEYVNSKIYEVSITVKEVKTATSNA